MARKSQESNKETFGRSSRGKSTSSSGNPSMLKFASMNKAKKRNYKVYRGQGRV